MVANRNNIDIHPEDKIEPDSMINPSSNMIARNPTRIDLSKEADDQRDIVNAIKEAQGKRKKMIYEYIHRPDGKWEFSGLPGLIKIRDMTEEELVEFCRTLMRFKPNMTGIILSFGEYSKITPYTGQKIAKLSFRKPRYPTEVAKDLADLIGDKALRIVKVDWQVNSAGPGAFECIGRAWQTSEEEYEDLEKFSPRLEVEFFSM